MTDRPREKAVEILASVEQGAFADALLDEARAHFDSRDSAFILELVYGVLRRRTHLDWVLNQFSKQPVSGTDIWTRNILRLAAYQMLFLDKVPVSAAVNTATGLGKKHGGKSGYVNGMLRNLDRRRNALPRTPAGDAVRKLSILHSHPEWLVRRWTKRFGEDRTGAILAENNRPAPLILRANTTKTTRDALKASLEGEGAVLRETLFSPDGLVIVSSPGLHALNAYRAGEFIVQDEAAQLISFLLGPRPGETVLDAAAAPGGKTTHIAQLMKNQGTVIALENDPRRIGKISENSERLGMSIIKPVVADAAQYREGMFDKVLIDAPCSGLGVLRRHPDGRWTKKEPVILEKQAVQKKILENVSRLLKPGGSLVYATCTTEPEENEVVIDSFLRANPDFALADPRPLLPSPAHALVDERGFFRTFPAAPDLDGFFGARVIRSR